MPPCAAPVLLPARHWSVVHQLAEDDLLRLRFQAVHQPHPSHRVAGFQRFRHTRRLHQLRHHLLQSLPRRLVDLPQVREQRLGQDHLVPENGAMLLKVRLPQHPVLTQGLALQFLAQLQVGNLVISVLRVSQFGHVSGSFRAHNFGWQLLSV